jgi:hypothetical protein
VKSGARLALAAGALHPRSRITLPGAGVEGPSMWRGLHPAPGPVLSRLGEGLSRMLCLHKPTHNQGCTRF